MGKEFEQIVKASRRNALVSIIGVVLALSSLVYLFYKSQSLENSDKEFSQVVSSQNNEIEFLRKEIENTKFYKYCSTDFSSVTDRQLLSIDSEIFGQGSGSASFTRNQQVARLTDWCKANSATSTSIQANNQPQYTVERKSLVKTFSERNNHCEREQMFVSGVTPSKGWELDDNSIKVNLNSISSNSKLLGIQNANKNGFEIRAVLLNNGECLKVLGSTLVKDGRGFINVTVKYDETRRVRVN